MNEGFKNIKYMEYILLILVLVFTTYPLFVDIQEKPEIAFRAFRQSAIFSILIVLIVARFFKKTK